MKIRFAGIYATAAIAVIALCVGWLFGVLSVRPLVEGGFAKNLGLASPRHFSKIQLRGVSAKEMESLFPHWDERFRLFRARNGFERCYTYRYGSRVYVFCPEDSEDATQLKTILNLSDGVPDEWIWVLSSKQKAATFSR